MKKALKIFVILISLLLGISTNGMAKELPSYNITLDGNRMHFIYTKGNSDKFLQGKNMMPGDSVSGTLTIENHLKEPFNVFLRAERVGKKEKIDLAKVLNLVVNYNGNNVYNGSVSGEDGLRKDIYLGVVKPGERKTLEAKAILDGNATDNKYKNKKLDVNWVFTAIGTNDNSKIISNDNENTINDSKSSNNILQNGFNKIKAIIPKTGYNGMFGVGAILIILGIILLAIKVRNSRKEKAL